jgi:hypothetical protein
MAEEKKEKIEELGEEVEILSREEIVTFPKLKQPKVFIAVIYATKDLPPATVWIPKEEYSIEKEKEMIREDIKRRKSFMPEVYKV